MFLQTQMYYEACTLLSLRTGTISYMDEDHVLSVAKSIASNLDNSIFTWSSLFEACDVQDDLYMRWASANDLLWKLRGVCSEMGCVHDLSTLCALCENGTLREAANLMHYRRWYDAPHARVMLSGDNQFIRCASGSVAASWTPQRCIAAYTSNEVGYLSVGFVALRNRITHANFTKMSEYGCYWSEAEVIQCHPSAVSPADSLMMRGGSTEEIVQEVFKSWGKFNRDFGF